MRGDQRRVNVERQPLRRTMQLPEPAPGARVRDPDRVQQSRRGRDPVDDPKRRRVRRHRSEQHVLLSDRAEVRDALAAVDQHHRQIADHPARVMTTTPPFDRSQPRRQRRGEPHLVSDLRDERAARVRDQTCSVRRDFYGYWAFITHHLQGEPPSSGSRTFDKPKDPCSAGRFRAPAHRGRGRYCTLRANGIAVNGPDVAWIGRRHGRRKDRRWAKSWSPEQISNRLRLDFPDDESMQISHEAIYQSLFVQGRGALRRELSACLRTGRALRVPRARTRRGKSFVTDEILISERPAEAEDRAVPGHWEGDLILGLESSAIGTLVERSIRFTMLLHLPPMEAHGGPRVKNGPALAGHGAEAVSDAIADAISTLPEQLRRSLTWDQGAEMAGHAQLRIDTGLQVYFCDPQSPWQRGSNENTNGLLRQYFPKGTDLSRHSAEDLAAVAATLNGRPRKTLSWRTPAEALDEHLRIMA